MSIFSRQPRSVDGRYGNKGRRGNVIVVVLSLVVATYFIFGGHEWLMDRLDREMHAVSTAPKVAFAPVAEASEDVAAKTVQELREEMVAKIWYGESRNYEPKPGEVFHTYDPSRSMIESGECSRIGGKRPIDCDSYGVMQIKIGTLQHMYPLVYGEEISQMDAIALTQDPEKAKKFAVDCWVRVEGCIWHWTSASAHEEYFRTVIPIIRKLEQE